MVMCPDCGGKRFFAHKYYAARAMKKGAYCRHCANKGNRCYRYGMELSQKEKERIRGLRLGAKLSDSHKSKIAEAGRLRYLSDEERQKTSELTKIAMHNPEIRKRHIKALAETKWLGKAVDRGQLDLLKRWNEIGFKFEPNYQVHTDDFLCYVDGFDKEHNVALEYDSKYHHRPHQQQKDSIRQQKIIDILRPKKFWRYDAANKQWENVLEKEG